MKEGLAELAVGTSCVVLTRVTHAPTHVARCQVQGHVKVAAAGMPMALAFWGRMRKVGMEWAAMARKARLSGMAPTPAGMGVPRLCRMPGVVLV